MTKSTTKASKCTKITSSKFSHTAKCYLCWLQFPMRVVSRTLPKSYTPATLCWYSNHLAPTSSSWLTIWWGFGTLKCNNSTKRSLVSITASVLWNHCWASLRIRLFLPPRTCFCRTATTILLYPNECWTKLRRAVIVCWIAWPWDAKRLWKIRLRCLIVWSLSANSLWNWRSMRTVLIISINAIRLGLSCWSLKIKSYSALGSWSNCYISRLSTREKERRCLIQGVLIPLLGPKIGWLNWFGGSIQKYRHSWIR